MNGARQRTLHRDQSMYACNPEHFVKTINREFPLAAAQAPEPGAGKTAQDIAVRQDDMLKALALPPYWEDAHGSVYILPDAPWGHRCGQDLNALLARLHPERANAVLCPKGVGHYSAKIQESAQVSIASRSRRWLIEQLPKAELDNFIQAFSACHWGALRSPVFRAWQ